MDPTGFGAVKNQSEVAVLIHGGEEEAVAADFSSKNFGAKKDFNSKPPKFPGTSKSSLSPSSSPKRTPGSPHSSPLHRQPSSSGPAFTKSKSRFAEPPPPTSPSCAVLDTNRHPESDISFSSPSNNSVNPLIPPGPQKGTGDEEEGIVKQTDSQRRRCGTIWAWIDRSWRCSIACGCIDRSGKCGIIWACVEWSILISAMVCLAMSLTIRRLRSFVLWDMEIWKWCLLVSGICCARLISHWYTKSLVFLVKRSLLLMMKKNVRKNTLYYMYELKNNIRLCVWITLVFYPLSVAFDSKIHRSPKTARVLGYVHRALASLLAGSMIWLLKSLVVKMLASSFHMKRFFDRIQESLYHQYLLTLLGHPATEPGKGQVYRKESEESGEIDMEKLFRMSHEEVHAWMMKGLINKIKLALTTDFIEQDFDNRSGEHGEREIGSQRTATVVASQIFKNVAGQDSKTQNPSEQKKKPWHSSVREHGGKTIRVLQKSNNKRAVPRQKIKEHLRMWLKILENMSDLCFKSLHPSQCFGRHPSCSSHIFAEVQLLDSYCRLGTSIWLYIEAQHLLKFFPQKKDADNVLQMLKDAVKSEMIEESTLTNWLVKAYFDRKSLKHSLNDTKTAVDQMNKLVNGVVGFVIIITTLLMMGVLTIRILAFLCSPLILLAVVFGNACKTAFDAIIFLFVMHPFDVGDRCVIDDIEMVVEEMYILTTVFMGDGNRKIYYPNSVLATIPITNFYRSPDMGDSVLLSVDAKTSTKCVGDLKDEVKDSKPGHWRPTHRVMVKDMEFNKMNMELYVNHTMNYQNMIEKNSRWSELVVEHKKIFQGRSIKYK